MLPPGSSKTINTNTAKVRNFMNRKDCLAAFSALGSAMRAASAQEEWLKAKEKSMIANPWFDEKDIDFAVARWSENLTQNNLEKWTENYPIPVKNSKTVGVVMAGNIPLVGFHDFLCVLMAGHAIQIKLSSDDARLLPYWAGVLMKIEPYFREKIQFTDRLNRFDAVIATGSNNTSLYFEYYFGKYPHIIRKSRCSIAILNGEEKNMKGLAEDIFLYKGMGCCSVGKLFVPDDYSFDALQYAASEYDYLKDHAKYRNNLDYYRAVYTMNKMPFLDFGNLLLVENKEFESPMSVVYYSRGRDLDHVGAYNGKKNIVQRLVSELPILPDAVPLGMAQRPALWEYMDDVDTMKFLCSL